MGRRDITNADSFRRSMAVKVTCRGCNRFAYFLASDIIERQKALGVSQLRYRCIGCNAEKSSLQTLTLPGDRSGFIIVERLPPL
ncbi:hypothetical protein [Jiella avicenniae]|uniref:Uncharacterized protein n=1 Tax=Jiella avicenniae TaxID=2907202 RepID=A0A9X1P5R9_9HYPH|nr:hypothetical protein [Jiella avicenniae]MCE7031006.1 hypothetical protein [Jiella avicenniae]